MCRYVFACNVKEENGEKEFHFPRFPEIISSIPVAEYDILTNDEIEEFIHDAVLVALEAIIFERDEVPENDDPNLCRADHFVQLNVTEAMTLQLYELFKANAKTKTVREFAKMIGKPETAVRRMLDIQHNSMPVEIEKVCRKLGKKLVHDWSIVAA